MYVNLSQGGLGICSVEKVNKALLGKWLWRVGELGQGLWKELIICKYKLGNNGWCVPIQANRISGLWRSVLLVQVEFAHWVRYTVHDGLQVKFWHDEWCGKSVLSTQFSNLFCWIIDIKVMLQTIF
eukprot:TRINITY_DN9968_c1_g1_i1.p1 TRINITY_DN9968_c1_g1~~TRINITY_DN9968_c1_g1_i1.p1  ORF type:complete len:126 (+),score=10.55 TRINITY_DN9968_c1_g1_i1:2296-2673(+)